MKTYKKILLILFIFFMILFIKTKVFAVTITSDDWEGAPNYSLIPDIELSTKTDSYLLLIKSDRSSVQILEPYNANDYLVLHTATSNLDLTYNRFSSFSLSSNSLTDCKYHYSKFNSDTDTWSDWSTEYKSTISYYAPSNGNFIYKCKSNIGLYSDDLGIIGKQIFSSGISLPNNLKLTDNITIFRHSLYDGEGIYLLYSDNIENNFKLGTNFSCVSPSGSNTYFDLYMYNSSTNTFEFKQKTDNYNTGLAVGNEYFYSTNDIYSGESLLSYASGDFFDFYYEDEEYIFPYIADTDEVLSNLDNFEDILIFPGSLSKTYLPINFKINKYTDPLSDKELIFELALDSSSPYYLYIVENPDDYWWEVPTELFKNSLENGSEYHFILSGTDDSGEFYSISRSITYGGTTYVPPTDEEIQTEAIKDQTEKIEEQTEAIKEQTEVSKNIFQRIGDILSYINPLSENFFAYKLIDLLIDALKSLFIPEERLFRYLF